MSQERLQRVGAIAEQYDGPTDVDSIRRICASTVADERLLAIMLIHEQPYTQEWFELARSMVGDTDNDCRWQAVIAIGLGIEIEPEWVWSVILEFGASDDEDMRAAIGCVLLEDLLDFAFDEYFPKIKTAANQHSADYRRTAGNCLFEITDSQKEQWQSFLDEVDLDRSKR